MDRLRFEELCKKNGITIAELERTLGMSNGSLRKTGDIKSERAMAIADYFGVSLDYLMGKNVITVNSLFTGPANIDIDNNIPDEFWDELSKLENDEKKISLVIQYMKLLNGGD